VLFCFLCRKVSTFPNKNSPNRERIETDDDDDDDDETGQRP
jgi:hypothetical protein